MSSRPLSALREVLESIGPKKSIVRATLESHLIASGRAVDKSKPSDNDIARNERAEASSRKVLETIEKATVAQQQKWNERIDQLVAPLNVKLSQDEQNFKALPLSTSSEIRKSTGEAITALKAKIKDLTDKKVRLTHAVSAHGKGSEQEARVLHGHRADEAVTGTPDTVGSDPSNTSGAFTTNQGMLQTFNEAFAQADMLSHQGELQRAQGVKDPTLDQSRFATTIEGSQPVGYNIEVEGVAKQTPGRKLLPEEIEQRRATMVRTDGLRNATVVMDPGYLFDDRGNLVLDKNGEPKRAGWNIQTAFAHGDAPRDGSSYANVGEVGKGTHQQKLDLETKTTKADTTRKALGDTRKELEEAFGSLKAAQGRIADANVKIEEQIQAVTTEGVKVQSGQQVLEALQTDFSKLDDLEADAQQQLPDLLQKTTLIGQALVDAQDEISDLLTKLEELDNACYEESDGGFIDFDSPPAELKEDRKEHHAVLEKAMTLARSLGAKAKLVEKQLALEAQRNKDALTVTAEAEKLKKDPAVVELQKKEVATKSELATLDQQTLDLRRAMTTQDAEHEAEYGKGPQGAATEGYDPAKGEYTGDRPDKPPVLTGVDEGFDPLTAHHLYPWNKIKADLNKALRSRSAGAMKALFQFADFKPGAKFFDELAKEPAARDYKFASDVNVAAQMICWSPRNIFMGPLGEKRSDDPGEELDETFEADRKQQTLNTRIAHAMEKQGGVSPRLDPTEIKADLAQPKFDQKLAELLKYKKEKEKNPSKKGVTKQEIDDLMAEAEKEAEPLVESTRLEREAAALETAKLLEQRSKLEADRAAPLAKQIESFKEEHKLVLGRLTPEQVREDLKKLAEASNNPKPVDFRAVDEEVERRRVLVRKLAELNDKLAHAPKAYDKEDWQVDKDEKKSQKKAS